MNKKILALVLASVTFFLGCSADGFIGEMRKYCYAQVVIDGEIKGNLCDPISSTLTEQACTSAPINGNVVESCPTRNSSFNN